MSTQPRYVAPWYYQTTPEEYESFAELSARHSMTTDDEHLLAMVLFNGIGDLPHVGDEILVDKHGGRVNGFRTLCGYFVLGES